MNKKKILIIGGIILFIMIVLGFIIHAIYIKNSVLEVKSSLITMQSEDEDNFVIDGYDFDNPNVILDPYESSPLTALAIFKTDDDVDITVTVLGHDDNSTISHTFEAARDHYIPIYGLYPDSLNKVILEYTLDGTKFIKELEVQTDKLPDDFILPTSVKASKSKLDNEFYFYSPASTGYTCAYDVNGDVRWYLSHNAVWDIKRLQNGHLMVGTEKLVNTPYYVTGLYEIDMLGKIYNEYDLKGGYHHDFYEMPNGNLLVASNDFNNEDGTVEDYIVELDRQTGGEVKHFDLKDILSMTDGANENSTSYDWFHNNSVWYDEDTNSITLSGRHIDAVVNIDYDTGNINWILGDSTNWSEEYQKYFFTPVGNDFEWQWSQHAAMITPEGYVFLFDNGNNKSKNEAEYVEATDSYSRGVMYKIDTEKMTIEEVWEYGKERGHNFYSPYISDVDYLSNDHYIVHSGGIVYVDGKQSNKPAGLSSESDITLKSDTVELLNDKVIFELVLPTNYYRVEKMSIYNDTELELGHAGKLGTLGETDVNDEKMGMTFGKDIDDDYLAHNISFTKEEDRLVFTGQFLRGSDPYVILSNGISSKYYKMRISKHPYTALCIDVFTEEENENGIIVNRYINNEGLSGKYNIYVKIGDTVYDTNKSVAF